MDDKINITNNKVSKEEEQDAGKTDLPGESASCSSFHHSHGKHHSSHKHRSKKRKKTPNKKLIWTLIAVMFVLLIVLVFAAEKMASSKANGDNGQTNENFSEILSVELINEEGVLVNDAVLKYISADILNSHNSDMRPSDFSNESKRLDQQVPVSLKLSTKNASALLYKIEISDNELFENPDISYLNAPSGTHEFKHLYANTEYFYRVTVYTNSTSESLTGRFKTADTPRILSIEGISNVRDIGNWQTDSGNRIKQGLLIRGTEMDGAVENTYHLTNDGIIDMLDAFGIKTDMDLRAQLPLSSDALGARAKHTYYDMVMYADIFTDAGKEKVKKIFSDLADPGNYPVYMHCTYGCDRTGTVCYLLEALLGVSKGDCLKEYGLSNLYIDNILAVENGLKIYSGSSLKEQTESYLISCGISEFQIKSIRDIFLGE